MNKQEALALFQTFVDEIDTRIAAVFDDPVFAAALAKATTPAECEALFRERIDPFKARLNERLAELTAVLNEPTSGPGAT